LNSSSEKIVSNLRSAVVLPIVVIALVSLAVYFNALFNGFVYDDVFQVTENQWITNIHYISDIFLKSVWSFQDTQTVSNYYRPMMHLIYMVSYYIFGLNPLGFHLENILFHTANSILVFLVAFHLLGGGRSTDQQNHQKADKLASLEAYKPESRQADKLSSFQAINKLTGPQALKHAASLTPDFFSVPFIAALLFAVHPIHTEAVTWVAGLPEVSFTFFSFLAFYLYMLSDNKITRNYIFSVLFFFAASLCKETALILLPLLVFFDYAFRAEWSMAAIRWRRYIPYLVVTGVYLIMRFNALGGFAPEKKHADLSTYQYVINVFPLFAQYLEKLLFPVRLNAFYVLHPVSSLFKITAFVSLVVVIAFVALTIVAARRSRIVFLSLTIVALPLLPVLYIPALGENTFAERYLYLPSFGFVILSGIFFVWARTRLPKRTAAAIALMAIAGLYSIGTAERSAVWKNDLTLYTDMVRKSPDGFIPNNNLGYALLKAGRIEEGIEHLKIAWRLEPNLVKIIVNRGISYLKRGVTGKAVLELNNALLLNPYNADAHYYLGLGYSQKGWLNQAIDEYATALKLRPDYPNAHKGLAGVYAKQGRMDEAAKELEIELRLNPTDAQAHNDLGVLQLQEGSLDKAIGHFPSAVKLDPGDTIFRNNLDKALYMKSAFTGRHH
jgi:Tfp pilus assembly protein PilF